MLGRLVVKLLFKACVPLVAVAGVLTYGVYLKGGDPAGLWKHVATGAFGQAGAMFTQAKDDAAALAGNLSGEGGITGGLMKPDSTTVYTWTDAEGGTHFGTTAPSDISASQITVNPNVNVLAPVELIPAHSETIESGEHLLTGQGSSQVRGGSQNARVAERNRAVQQLESDLGESLPGIGGQLLSSGAAGGNGIDPSQLIRLLQSSGQ